jgi:DNA-binding cell septation regulator SpoVG
LVGSVPTTYGDLSTKISRGFPFIRFCSAFIGKNFWSAIRFTDESLIHFHAKEENGWNFSESEMNSMNRKDMIVNIQRVAKPGPLKAFAELTLNLPNGQLRLHGFSVIEQPGKSAWVGFPQKLGKVAGKYFPVTEADGDLHAEIAAAVLDAYKKIV